MTTTTQPETDRKPEADLKHDGDLKVDADLRVVGKPLPRVDAVGKLTGATAYADDIELPPGRLPSRFCAALIRMRACCRWKPARHRQ